jgi:GT2 family glycosyltransferase
MPSEIFSASIVLFENSPTDVLTAANSFLAAGQDGKLFLIDNSPTSVLQHIAELDNRVEYEHNPRNTGYVAHNHAMRKSIEKGFTYHLVLNPDVYFSPEVIPKIVAFMDENPDVGLLIPKIFFPDGELQYACKLLPTPFDFFLRMIFPRPWITGRMNSFELRISGYDQVMNVPYMSGCFMFFRNSTLNEVGLFDERFFMYAEDIDLSRRIYAQSRSVFYPDVSIVHRHEAASYKNWRLFKIHLVNVCRYFNKYGWFFDAERKAMNRKVLEQFRS